MVALDPKYGFHRSHNSPYNAEVGPSTVFRPVVETMPMCYYYNNLGDPLQTVVS